jgi:protoporphyrinogen oxidase
MPEYYKREVSLMDTKIFPRTSLDKPIENPDIENSSATSLVEKTDQEIIDNVVAELRKTGTK